MWMVLIFDMECCFCDCYGGMLWCSVGVFFLMLVIVEIVVMFDLLIIICIVLVLCL